MYIHLLNTSILTLKEKEEKELEEILWKEEVKQARIRIFGVLYYLPFSFLVRLSVRQALAVPKATSHFCLSAALMALR